MNQNIGHMGLARGEIKDEVKMWNWLNVGNRFFQNICQKWGLTTNARSIQHNLHFILTVEKIFLLHTYV